MEPKRYFPYGDEEMAYLAKKDAKLGWAISRIGLIQRPVEPNLFEALVSSVVGQQISGKALATIWGRIQKRFVPLTPETLAAAPRPWKSCSSAACPCARPATSRALPRRCSRESWIWRV